MTQTEPTVNVQETTETRKAWDRIAGGYDAHVTPTHQGISEESLRRVGVRAGTRFLDVAAGTGALSIPASRAGAHVTATDLSPRMVERLQARAREEDLPNLEARVMDGHALDLADGTFDVTGSQFGVMLFPDLPRGLSEMTRVTKPGGRVFVSVYGHPSRVEFLSVFMQAMKTTVPGFKGLPMDPLPLPFQASDPDVLAHRLTETGLRDVRVHTMEEQLRFTSGDDMWAWLMNSNPIPGMLVADTTEAQRAEARGVLDDLLRARASGADAAVLKNPVHVGIGTK